MNYYNQESFINSQRRQPPPLGPGPFPRPPGPPPGPGPRPRPPGPPPGPRPDPGNAPRSAPPNYTPSRQMAALRVDSSSIRNCLGRFTYIWMSNGDEFWMFPIQVSRNTVTGFRWNGRFGWTFFGVSLNRIDAFTCV